MKVIGIALVNFYTFTFLIDNLDVVFDYSKF